MSKFLINTDTDSISPGIIIHIITPNISTTPTIDITRLIPFRVFSFFKNFTFPDIFSNTLDNASIGTLSIMAIIHPKSIGLTILINVPTPPNILPILSATERLIAITMPNIIISFFFSLFSIRYNSLFIGYILCHTSEFCTTIKINYGLYQLILQHF